MHLESPYVVDHHLHVLPFFLAEMKSALLLVCITIALVAVSDSNAISESKARPSTIMVQKK